MAKTNPPQILLPAFGKLCKSQNNVEPFQLLFCTLCTKGELVLHILPPKLIHLHIPYGNSSCGEGMWADGCLLKQ